jgi:alpha-glucosidase
VTTPWWKSCVVYQIYPRSFADADGDGVGDLEGVRDHLDHLAWLGVDAVWFSPIFRSPMADFGYDVSDYCDVDPVFGSLDTFDRLVDEAHQRGLRVLLDWVPNHTSDRHPWFLDARSSREASHRDWYVWRDGRAPGLPPTDWSQAFAEPARWARDPATGELVRQTSGEPGTSDAGSAWTFDDATGQWYLHLFLPEQPDLDWGNPEVEVAMHDTLRFWLDRGVDGFRADVVHLIGKDVDQASLLGTPQDHLGDTERTHEVLRGIRKLLDSYPGERMMVGEVYILDPRRVASFYGDGDELHLSFNFLPLHTRWSAPQWARRIAEVEEAIDPAGWPVWVLSNHDTARHRSRYGSESRARAAAVLLLGLRGTPFLYAGEELGLEDAEIPPERIVDPGGRDGCRAPIPWIRASGHGWGADPWLPFPPDASERSVEAQREEPGSVLHLYRRLLAARKLSPALTLGDQQVIDAGDAVLAWTRALGADRRTVAVNFTSQEASLALPGHWEVEVASDGQGEDSPWSGHLLPDQAVVLRPA